ncbi:MAG: DUF3784 domain-containing protein [Thomasclavelia sp.]|nr:DUF3784 domain-containing protein [Thomasclavelia sp.]
MNNIVMIIIGVLMLVIGYLLVFKQKINLLHSYHYKRVQEKDKPTVCRYTGLGNIIIGIGMIVEPIFAYLISETVGLIICCVFVGVGVIIAVLVIMKYNNGLF